MSARSSSKGGGAVSSRGRPGMSPQCPSPEVLLSRWCSVTVDQLVGRSSSQVVMGSCRFRAPDSTSDKTTVERTSLLIEPAWKRDCGLQGWLPGPPVTPTERSATTSDPRTTTAVPDQAGQASSSPTPRTVAVTDPIPAEPSRSWSSHTISGRSWSGRWCGSCCRRHRPTSPRCRASRRCGW